MFLLVTFFAISPLGICDAWWSSVTRGGGRPKKLLRCMVAYVILFKVSLKKELFEEGTV